ncbi:MAG TPA: DUF3572 family protein [Sphingomicrobium sp.]|jgi:hypothetical protein|nr:DUF3572 family protein [Sphingomicrobium sp.]
MPLPETNEAELLALRALVAALEQKRLAERFLSLSGLSVPELRQMAGQPKLLAAFLVFLEAHEPDLVAIAEQVGVRPGELVAARQMLEA